MSKRSMKKIITGVIAITVAAITFMMPQTMEASDGVVTRVVDGDTIVIQIDGIEEKVRLIGVDTPESVHPDESRNVEYGKIASDYTEQMLLNREVEIELDVGERDRYGRILAYVYLDGKMFNELLLAEGHAKVSTVPPNVKYADRFVAIQNQARESKKGVWAYESLEAMASVTGTAEKENAVYAGNVNSKVFHLIDCSSVGRSAEYNLIYFAEREDAVERGYLPCERCTP
jgi:micrococcal nuclease